MNSILRAGGLDLELLRAGSGRALLLIHGINPISPAAPFVQRLAATREVFAPSHPGFGGSRRPADFDTMYDLVNLYRDVLDAIPGDTVDVIGFSFGGWIAAELAVGGASRLGRLVLVDPVGIKLGGREDRDIVHFFNTSPRELDRRAWAQPAQQPRGSYGLGWQAKLDDPDSSAAISDAELVGMARNWDTLCLFAWTPHMFNPQLAYWLRRIRAPTLVVWGERDQIVSPDYGRGYATRIPGAAFHMIRDAGHHPELEQPAAFVASVQGFLQEGRGDDPNLR